MIPTARVQRGPSEAARCASTGIVPATPPLFSILLRQYHIQRLPHFLNADQLNPIDGIELGQVPFR